MAYCTTAGVRLALVADGVSLDPATAASMDDTAILPACGAASDEVDARLGVLYSVPFVAPPQVVIDLATDLAAYLATLTFRKGMPLDGSHPVALRYARARSLLLDLARGNAQLPALAPQPPGTPVVSNPTPRLFGRRDFDLVPSLEADWGGRW